MAFAQKECETKLYLGYRGAITMDNYENYIHSIANSLSIHGDELPQDILLAEALITAQKIINCATSIKVSMTKRDHPQKIGTLVLLCAKLEMINNSLTQITREYNLWT